MNVIDRRVALCRRLTRIELDIAAARYDWERRRLESARAHVLAALDDLPAPN